MNSNRKKTKGLGLCSGGLDSILSALVLRRQGIQVEWIVFETPFFSADKALRAARLNGIPITVKPILPVYLEMLKDPPAGMVLDKVAVVPQGLELTLKAGAEVPDERRVDNLIVEVVREYTPKQKDGTLSKKKRRYSLGVLPALPIEIVSP